MPSPKRRSTSPPPPSSPRAARTDVRSGTLPPEPTPFIYRAIRVVFRLTSGIFYSTTETHGLEHVPPPGSAMIVCFNHGNGLADPMVLIRKTPRVVRFCAKDTLWKMPIMNWFIRGSGAVPVYRRREHGEQAESLNLEIFAELIAALRQGHCLGFAPEGVSRFLPYMEQPLKTGVARIALEAVTQARAAGAPPSFAVRLVPVGLAFTHREKFRSDLCMQARDAHRNSARNSARNSDGAPVSTAVLREHQGRRRRPRRARRRRARGGADADGVTERGDGSCDDQRS